MSFSSITIRKFVPKNGKRDLFQRNLRFRVEYKGSQADTTGLGGTWEASGNLYDVYLCQQYLVGVHAMSRLPVFVADNVPDLIDILREATKCPNITMM